MCLTIIPGFYGAVAVTSQSEVYRLDVDIDAETVAVRHLGTLKTGTSTAREGRDVALLANAEGSQLYTVSDGNGRRGLPSSIRVSNFDMTNVDQIPSTPIQVTNLGALLYPNQQGQTVRAWANALEWMPGFPGSEPRLFAAGFIGPTLIPGYDNNSIFMIPLDTRVVQGVFDLKSIGRSSAGDIAFDFSGNLYLSIDGGDVLEVQFSTPGRPYVIHDLPANTPVFDGLLPLEPGVSLVGIAADRRYYRIDLAANTAELMGTLEHPDPALLDSVEWVRGASIAYELPINLGAVSGTVNEVGVEPRLGQLWYQFTAGSDGLLSAALLNGGTAATTLKLYDSLDGDPLVEGTSGIAAQVAGGQTLWMHVDGLAYGQTADLQFKTNGEITLSPAAVAEDQPVGTVVGEFSTAGSGNPFTYHLVAGVGSTNNASFTITGNQLKTNAVFDHQAKSLYEIRVRSTDQAGFWSEQSFIIMVLPGDMPDGIGMYDDVMFRLDTSGNGTWDKVSGGDTFRNFGLSSIAATAKPLTGDWDGDGDDDLGLYNAGLFYLDTTQNGVWDKVSGGDTFRNFGLPSLAATAKPVVGDWDGDGDDDVGLYNAGLFYLDTTENGVWDKVSGGDTFRDFKLAAISAAADPVIGDWDGDGDDDLGLYNAGLFYLDTTQNGVWNRVSGGDTFRDFGLASLAATAHPVTGDWDGDGDDDLGLYNDGYFYLDTTQNGVWDKVSGGDTFHDFGVNAIRSTGLPLAGQWDAPAPLLAAGGPVIADANVPDLTEAQLTPVLNDALAQWATADIPAADLSKLGQIDVKIGDLPGGVLGTSHGASIVVDVDAAGHGWFADTTPGRNEEFTFTGDPAQLTARPGTAADSRMDLLTVVMHELGHVLGFHDAYADVAPGDLMNGWLDTGLRRTLTPSDRARLFADADWLAERGL